MEKKNAAVVALTRGHLRDPSGAHFLPVEPPRGPVDDVHPRRRARLRCAGRHLSVGRPVPATANPEMLLEHRESATHIFSAVIGVDPVLALVAVAMKRDFVPALGHL